MPFPGIPDELTDKMDRCIKNVISEQNLPKDKAIAICHDSIMGNKKKPKSKKAETVKEVKIKVSKKIEKKIEKSGKPEKATSTKGQSASGGKKVEKKATKKILKKDSKVAKSGKAKKVAEIEDNIQLAKLLKSTIEKVDKLLVKAEEKPKEKSAPAEGAASKPEPKAEVKEDAPKVEKSETPKEEAKLAEPVKKGSEKIEKGASSEGAETTKALEKVSDSLAKFTDKLTKFEDKFEKVEERLTKLEEQPAPSKVVSSYVVSKGGALGDAVKEDEKRLKEINKKLSQYEQIKDTDLMKYQTNKLGDKAFNLSYEKSMIISRNPELAK